MKNPILSIIVPSYNTAKFVDICVPFFIHDPLFDLARIIFVDDGATDNTRIKLQPFLEKYPDYFSFFHKENGGHGSVINFCIEKAVRTKYFRVVDGDDFVDPENLLKLCFFLQESDFDLVVDDYTRVYADRSERIKSLVDANKPELLSSYILNLHNMTFKWSLFNQNNIKVREHVFYEDNEYVLFPLEYVRTFHYFPVDIYRYRLGNQEQSVSVKSKLKRRDDSRLINLDIMSRYLLISKNETKCNDVVICYMKKLSLFLTNEYILDLFSIRDTKEIEQKFYEREIELKKMPKLRSYMLESNKKYRLLSNFKFKHTHLLKIIFRLKLGRNLVRL